MQSQRCTDILDKQHRGMVSKQVCRSLSCMLEQVAMGVAWVIKLGPMQQGVLLNSIADAGCEGGKSSNIHALRLMGKTSIGSILGLQRGCLLLG